MGEGSGRPYTLLESSQEYVLNAYCWKCHKWFRITPFYVVRRGWQEKDSLTFRPKHRQCGTRVEFVIQPKDKVYRPELRGSL